MKVDGLAEKTGENENVSNYLELATEAIASLKNKKGSSKKAIKKYIMANNTGLAFDKTCLDDALKEAMLSGQIVRNKRSYQLPSYFDKNGDGVDDKKNGYTGVYAVGDW